MDGDRGRIDDGGWSFQMWAATRCRTGSCGQQAGSYGMTDVNSGRSTPLAIRCPGLFYQINYSGVPAPTTIGVIARYNGELESQVQVAQFTAQNAGGTATGAITANISPGRAGLQQLVFGQPWQPRWWRLLAW